MALGETEAPITHVVSDYEFKILSLVDSEVYIVPCDECNAPRIAIFACTFCAGENQ